MNKRLICPIAAVATVFASLAASTPPIDDNGPRIPLEPATVTNLNRIGLSYRMGFNFSASFHGLGGFGGANAPASPHGLRTPNGDPFNYDNGYVYPDQSTGSAHPGYTWYYGYAAGTPQRPAGAPTDFDLYRSSSLANISSLDNDSDPQHGFELTYDRQIGRVGPGFWGFEAAAGYTHLTIQDNRTFHAAVARSTDTYRTGGGAVLNPAPFEGTVTGPGPNDVSGWPLVSLMPVSSSSQSFAAGATITGERELDAQAFSFRLGPYLDLPLSHRWLCSFSAGLLALEVCSKFEFNETVTIDPSISLVSLPSEQHHGSSSRNDLLLGGYVGANISYALSERVRLMCGAQFQTTDNFTQTVAGKSAVLNLGQTVFTTLGLSYSF